MADAIARPLPVRAQALLDFWFATPDAADFDRSRDIWFTADAAFDAALRARFLDDQKLAAAGRYDGWMGTADGSVALVLLLDQLPRNLYRGTPAAFASDEKALSVARQAVARGFDGGLADVRRWFLYLPFEHSESLADQETSVALFRSLPKTPDNDVTADYALRHREIIRRFGRFPHRNRILGRLSTPEEEAFLQQPNSSF